MALTRRKGPQMAAAPTEAVEIDVPHIPEPDVPEEGVIDPTDTYTEGPGSDEA